MPARIILSAPVWSSLFINSGSPAHEKVDFSIASIWLKRDDTSLIVFPSLLGNCSVIIIGI